MAQKQVRETRNKQVRKMEGVEGSGVVFVHRNVGDTAAQSGGMQGSVWVAWWRSRSSVRGKNGGGDGGLSRPGEGRGSSP